MTTVTIEEAQAKLPQLIEQLAAGEELVITRNHKPIARLHSEAKPQRQPRKAGNAKGILTILEDDELSLPGKAAAARPGPGLCKGAILYMAPDFDAPLEYME